MFRRPTISQQIAPYLIAGLGIVIVFTLLIFIAHLMVWGLALGVILYAAAWLKSKLFPRKPTVHYTQKGRIIDHEG